MSLFYLSPGDRLLVASGECGGEFVLAFNDGLREFVQMQLLLVKLLLHVRQLSLHFTLVLLQVGSEVRFFFQAEEVNLSS